MQTLTQKKEAPPASKEAARQGNASGLQIRYENHQSQTIPLQMFRNVLLNIRGFEISRHSSP
jgi:hypothetical protein